MAITVSRHALKLEGYAPIVGEITMGTLFLHGLFFAHEFEKSSHYTGSTKALHWLKGPEDIRKEKKWVRPAR